MSVKTTAIVDLELDQPGVEDIDTGSAFGQDARNLEIELPKNLKFQFTAFDSNTDEIGVAKITMFGQTLELDGSSKEPAYFDASLQRIIFPMAASGERFEVQESASSFNWLSGSALIQECGWALPVASIDFTQPTTAAGIGAVMVRTRDGITDSWAGMKSGNLKFLAPTILVEPGQIVITDLPGGIAPAYSTLKLWKDDVNTFGTEVKLSFGSSKPFIWVTNANGNELCLSHPDADFQIDRPVTVDGSPPRVYSVNSVLIIAANKDDRLIYLFDDDLLESGIGPDITSRPMTIAMAMKNALFKLSQAKGCLVFGSLSKAFDTIEGGQLFLTFDIQAYIPTLPDPYAADLGALKNQLHDKGSSKRNQEGKSTGQSVEAMLVSRTKWDIPITGTDTTQVEVSFHFAPLGDQLAGISL
jgi:hypothetical protein